MLNALSIKLSDRIEPLDELLHAGGSQSLPPAAGAGEKPKAWGDLTGYAGMKLTAMADIVILVSSLHKVKETGQQFVFTDRHAYLQTAMYSSELSDLKTLIDWPQLRARDFQRDPEKPEKFERYQAEALVHSHLPLAGLVGAACQNAEVQQKLLDAAGPILSSTLKIMTLPKWFFLT